jgi:hypothetical protein
MLNIGRDISSGLIDKGVPVVAAVVDYVVVVLEDAIGKPVVAHELPSVLHDIELRAFRRQRRQGDVVRHGDITVPSGNVTSIRCASQPGPTSLGDDKQDEVGAAATAGGSGMIWTGMKTGVCSAARAPDL